jgi:hypothetical protein
MNTGTKNQTERTYPKTEYKVKLDDRNRRMMICSNSIPNGKHWKGKECNIYSLVGDKAVAVLCWKCSQSYCEQPVIRSAQNNSGNPKGWKFMKEYVDANGNVFHKGVEQPALKGTLKPTVIEPKQEKQKLTKQEKETLTQELAQRIQSLKVELFRETRKGKKAEMLRELKKANKDLSKLI